MVSLADLLAERGDDEEAESLYRRAASAGNTDAMVSLADRDDSDQAEALYRRAVHTDNNELALLELGILAQERGDAIEAEVFYRRAADAGNADAVTRLHELPAQRDGQTGTEH